MNHPQKGTEVSHTEHPAKQPSANPVGWLTGLFATLRALLRTERSGAPSPRLALAFLTATCATILAFLLLGAAPASATTTTFCPRGSGAGQCEFPEGVAVDQSTGTVYVADLENHSIDEFEAGGAFIRAIGAGQIRPISIAVDNSGGASNGDIYVADYQNHRIEKFTPAGALLLTFGEADIGNSEPPLATDPSGDLWVGDVNRLERFSEEGAFLSEVKLPGAGTIQALAIDPSTEDFYVISSEVEGVRKLKPNGETIETLDASGHPNALGLDPAGRDLFVSDQLNPRSSTNPATLLQFNSAGEQIEAFAIGEVIGRPVGNALAFGDTAQRLYVTGGEVGQSFALPPAGPLPGAGTAKATEIKKRTATLAAEVNPEGKPTTYHFQYITAQKFEEDGEQFGAGTEETEESAPIGEDFQAHPVSTPITGLEVTTAYRYRLVATNENALGGIDGETASFETEPPAAIDSVSVSDVSSDSATLEAQINPLGDATAYRFEYLSEVQYLENEEEELEPFTGAAQAPLTDASIGSGESDVSVSQHLQGLSPHTAYRYRVSAHNHCNPAQPAEECTSTGPSHAFETQTPGPFALPDGRGWELVSPPNPHGALLGGINEFAFVLAAADGSAVVYPAYAPTESQPRGQGEPIQVLSKHTPGSAWSSTDLLLPHAAAAGLSGGATFRVFSTDLTAGVVQPNGNFEPALSPAATEQTAYTYDTATGTFTPLVIGCRPGGGCSSDRNDTTEPFIPFGGPQEHSECLSANCGPNYQGATPDLSHIILGPGIGAGGEAPLLQGAPESSLYEWSAGQLAIVSELPEHAPKTQGHPSLGGGGFGQIVTHAVSDDGSRVFFSEQEEEGAGNQLLFMRDLARGETIEIGGGFEGANAQGTLVFYSGKECEIPTAGTLECTPVDGEDHLPVQDGTLLATSEDGAWVYFKKENNIYLRHAGGEPQLIAANVGIIAEPNAGFESPRDPMKDPWRASPDGQWFTFMSDSPLTGYDNHDAVTGEPDEEVYLYHATSNGGAGTLICASCDPTGDRPHGSPVGQHTLADYAGIMETPQRVAATIPGWAPYTPGHAAHDPRFLSDSGRLFFNATDALVPKDVNGEIDVYEFESPGLGSCTTGTRTGSDVYVPSEGGCVALISNGEATEDSVFMDASENGGDVFFLSNSKLSLQDEEGSLSMWDAHVCSTSSPCLPTPPTQPAPCNNESSCRPSPAPQPTISAAPASATFSGPGNPAQRRAVRCRRGFTRKKNRCVKQKHKRARKSNHGNGSK